MKPHPEQPEPARSPDPQGSGASAGSARKPGKLTLEEATLLARSCEYAWEAVQTDNPINWADASAFFLEGYEQGMRDAIRLIKEYKPKHNHASPNGPDQRQPT